MVEAGGLLGHLGKAPIPLDHGAQLPQMPPRAARSPGWQLRPGLLVKKPVGPGGAWTKVGENEGLERKITHLRSPA